jgi:hypothetical protein
MAIRAAPGDGWTMMPWHLAEAAGELLDQPGLRRYSWAAMRRRDSDCAGSIATWWASGGGEEQRCVCQATGREADDIQAAWAIAG